MSSLKKKCILFLEFDWDFKVFKKKNVKIIVWSPLGITLQ